MADRQLVAELPPLVGPERGADNSADDRPSAGTGAIRRHRDGSRDSAEPLPSGIADQFNCLRVLQRIRWPRMIRYNVYRHASLTYVLLSCRRCLRPRTPSIPTDGQGVQSVCPALASMPPRVDATSTYTDDLDVQSARPALASMPPPPSNALCTYRKPGRAASRIDTASAPIDDQGVQYARPALASTPPPHTDDQGVQSACPALASTSPRHLRPGESRTCRLHAPAPHPQTTRRPGDQGVQIARPGLVSMPPPYPTDGQNVLHALALEVVMWGREEEQGVPYLLSQNTDLAS
ncbi:hypothetical protein BDZ97DRAFT_1761781 [Flammula alnicola]|nr:hypothetical protein BDZ97DRAFT_1761781 [Flammula alnicola]